MSRFGRDRRLKLELVQLADMLHRMLAEEQTPETAPEAYYLPEFIHDAFRRQMLLYRQALLLKALIAQADDDPPLFGPLLRQYESILYPDSLEEAVRERRKQDIRHATAALGDLLGRPEDPDLSWGQRWFSEIGYKEINPVTLSLLLYFWIDYSVAVHESVAAMAE